jgi:hypothetical protein
VRVEGRKVQGKFFEESCMIIIEGFACIKSKLFCKDSAMGTMIWEDRALSCLKIQSKNYMGDAELYDGKHNSSRIIVIGSKEEDSYVIKCYYSNVCNEKFVSWFCSNIK